MKKNLITLLLLLFLLTGMAGAGLAQDPNDAAATTTTPDLNGPTPPNDVPIDGGLCLLLAAGLGYGVKRYRRMS